MPVLRTASASPALDQREGPVRIVINGTDAPETWNGTEFNDLIRGEGGDDRINSGAGSDTAYGGLGIDVIYGGAGDDFLNGGNANNSDFASNTDGGDTIYGEDGKDVIRGGWGDDQLFGGIGDDNLRGDAGADRLDGGDGNDLVAYRFDDVGRTTGVVFDVSVIGTANTVTLNDGAGSTDTLVSVEGAILLDTIFDDTFTGSMNYDQITVTAGVNIVNSGGGGDRIFAYAGATTVDGGTGDDIIYMYDYAYIGGAATAGTFTITGGDGNDIAYVGGARQTAGSTVVLTTSGELTATGGFTINGTDIEALWYEGGSGNDTATGADGADELYGYDGADVLNGGAGNDFLIGGLGIDRMTGGLGDDVFYVDDAGDVTVEAKNGGDDSVYARVSYTLGSSAYIERLYLEELTPGSNPATAAISGTGNNIANIITGNSLNNILDGGKGDDTLVGALGNDTYKVDSTKDVVVEIADQGDDTVLASLSYSLANTANVENLTLTGTGAFNATGNGLNNVITGNAGVNVLKGALGDDVYYVQNTGDTVVEAKDQGTDLVYSSVSFVLGASSYVENLTLTGSANLNGTGNNIANILTGNKGVNVLTGFKGDDVYYVQNTGDTVVEAKDQGTDLVFSSVTFTLGASSYVEVLTLTGSANINGTGNNIANVLIGNKGLNVLTGFKGDDIYYVQNTGDTAVEAKDQGTDLVYASVSFTLGASSYVEQLTLTGSANLNGTGNGIANVLTGNAGINVLTGGKGDDVYYVQNTGDTAIEVKGQGTDLVYSSVSFTLGASSYVENLTLTGSASIDGTGNGIDNLITGNAGINALTGGKGDDTLIGGGGRDTLSGGAGADKFVFKLLSDSVGGTSDLITDLTNADFIDLSAIDGNTSVVGVQGFTLVNAFTNAAGQMTLSYNAPNNTTTLNLDVNGDGAADMTVRITGDHDDFTHFIFGGG